MSDAIMTGVYGRRGQGKSTRVKEIIRPRGRVLVFDPMNEYGLEGFRRVDWQRLPAALSAGSFRLAYVPKRGHARQALDAICKHMLERWEGRRGGPHITLVIEEMSISFPSEKLPDELWGMAAMCEQGRHAGIDVIGTTQRPARVSTIFRGNCEQTYIFGLSDWNDVGAVANMIGPEWKNKLRELPQHEYLLYRDAKVTTGKNLLKP